jgi:3-hydroxy-3-methylglutaryl CoA synthase
MAVGSDTISRHTAPGTIQEYSSSAGAAAYILGSDPGEILAEIEPFTTTASDLSDGFRIEGERYIRSGGLPTQESGVGFLEHMVRAVRRHCERHGYEPSSFRYVVFQQPFGVVPIALAMRLGLAMDQVTPGLVAYEPASASRRCWTRRGRRTGSCWCRTGSAPAPT